MKKIIFILLIFASSILSAETKIFCDKCKKEFKPNTSFSIIIKVGELEQIIGSDLCDKCFDNLIKDLDKYNLKISSNGWKTPVQPITIQNGMPVPKDFRFIDEGMCPMPILKMPSMYY